MRYWGILILCFMITMALPGWLRGWAEESVSHGPVDWLKGTIRVIGIAHPEKKEADEPANPQKMLSVAKVSAQQYLLETIKQLRVSSTEKVDTKVGSDQLFMAKIQGLIKNAPIVQQAYLSDGTLQVTIEFGLWGAFSQLILPEEVKPIETITPLDAKISQNKDEAVEPDRTGIIVDAKGIGLKPALVPHILDDLGDQVYGPQFINRDFAVRWGMCGYVTTMEATQNTARAGTNPLTVKGIRATGPQRTDIVVSTADAARIRSISEHVIILREGRVIVVAD